MRHLETTENDMNSKKRDLIWQKRLEFESQKKPILDGLVQRIFLLQKTVMRIDFVKFPEAN